MLLRPPFTAELHKEPGNPPFKMTLIILEKRMYLLNLLKIFRGGFEVSAKNARTAISDTSYYKLLLPKLVEINSILRESKISYFVKPVFVKQGKKVLSGIRMNPKAKIKVNDNFIQINYENS